MLIHAGVAVGIGATAGACPVVNGRIVAFVDQPLADSIITSLNPPCTDDDGHVGFVIGFADGRFGVWYDDGLIWTSDQAFPEHITSAGGVMGVGNDGQFVIGCGLQGVGAIWGSDGLVMRVGDSAPTEPSNFAITFVQRPSMSGDGTAHWVAGTNDGMGGDVTFRRTLYRRSLDGTITRALRSHDFIGDAEINGFDGLDFDYAFSRNLSHRVIVFKDRLAPNTRDQCVGVDEMIVAREGTPTGHGDLWARFDHVSVNNAGHSLFTGRTDEALPRAIVLAYDGEIVLRGDMQVDGVTLGGIGHPSINDDNQVVFIAGDSVFFAADAADLGSARRVLSPGDILRVPSNEQGDWYLNHIILSASGPSLALTNYGRVFAQAELVSVEEPFYREAIIELAVPATRCPADFNADGTLDFFDVQLFLTALTDNWPCADRNNDDVIDFFDVQRFLLDYAIGCP